MKYDDVKPVPHRAVRVWLADGSRMLGMWTGEKWWSVKGEINPVNWELEERPKRPRSLRKHFVSLKKPTQRKASLTPGAFLKISKATVVYDPKPAA
jgi:hypothetical protein